jgi:TonB-dependent SusC/RagA subfamily outer membrane receptor
VRNVSLQKALEECLKGKPLTYIIIGKTVVIQFNEKYYNNARNVSDIIVSEKLPPPPINITGKVVNAEGNPIQGVSVILKGTKTGATTDSEGMYSITIPNNGVLVFSNIGYIEQEIPTSGKSVINISMTLSATSMDQIVVVGYGSQRKGDITGSIVSVDVDELNKVPSPNLAQQLQGRSSGVSVTSDNTPGGEPTIRIRGFGTINNNDPLYIIDGVPTKGGLNNINPNNIESIQILKDASAASIYGSRASNGVIIITTIKGKTGQSKLTFDARYGVQVPKNNGHADVILDPQKFGELKWKQLRNAQQLTNGNPVDPQYGNGTNPVVPDYILAGNKYGVFEGDPATNP